GVDPFSRRSHVRPVTVLRLGDDRSPDSDSRGRMVIWIRPWTARRRLRSVARRERRINVSSSGSATVVPKRAGRIAGTFDVMNSTAAAYRRRFLTPGAGARF